MEKGDQQQEYPAPVMDVPDKLPEQHLVFQEYDRIIGFRRVKGCNKTSVKYQ